MKSIPGAHIRSLHQVTASSARRFTALLKLLVSVLSFSKILTLVIALVRWTLAGSPSPINRFFCIGSARRVHPILGSSSAQSCLLWDPVIPQTGHVVGSSFQQYRLIFAPFSWQQANQKEAVLPATCGTRGDGRDFWREKRTVQPRRGPHSRTNLILSSTSTFAPYA